MDVRWQEELVDDELPGGLSFTDVDEPLPEPEPRSWPARLLRLLVVVAVLAAGGAAGARWLGEQDVRDVLSSSTATYAHVLGTLADARDADALASAAALAPRSAERLAADVARLRDEPGERRTAVADQVEAERAVLLALAPLERLTSAPLDVWGAAAGPLAAAVDAELRTRETLARLDEGAAEDLPDSAGALRQVAATVGTALVADVQRSAGDLLDVLDAAGRTADLRAAAERATGQRAAVTAAETGVAAGGEVLAAFGRALDAVRDLAPVTPADTGAWSEVRSRLNEHLGVVGAAGDSLEAGSVRARLPLVLTSVDGVVTRAADAHAAWQPAHDAAVAQQAADREALVRYGEAVRAAVRDGGTVRADVTALLASAPTTAEAWAAVAGHASAAELVVSSLTGVAPPAGTAEAHAALVAAATPLAGALRAAADALRLDPCQDCPADVTPAWAALVDAAASPDGLDAALAAVERAVADAAAAVDARPLPPPPDA